MLNQIDGPRPHPAQRILRPLSELLANRLHLDLALFKAILGHCKLFDEERIAM